MADAPRRRPGRPPIGHAAATKRIAIRVTPAALERLRRVAGEVRTPIATLVRDATLEYLAELGERKPPRR